MIPRSPLAWVGVGLLIVGVVAASFGPRPTNGPAAPLPPAPSVIAGGTARPGASPGVLGARMECPDPGSCTVAWETARLPVRVYAGPGPAMIDRSSPAAVATAGNSIAVPASTTGPTYVEVVADGDGHGPLVGARDVGPAGGGLRDLGGYRTRDGGAVAWGRWFVAGDLDRLPAATTATATALGLPVPCPRTVLATGPDPLSRAARRADARALRAATTDRPTWVRCADRSGDWPVVLALTVAGVPRETVVAAVLALQGADGRPPDRSTVDRPLERVVARYGSFRRYLRSGLGLHPREVAAFRRSARTPPGTAGG